MKSKGDLVPPESRSWTRVEDYFESLARRRTARRSRSPSARTQPEAPRFLLSTLPFLTLFVGLAVLAISIAIAAWPAGQPEAKKAQLVAHELGTAPKGWFQDAKREMHR